ncbi:MAG: hypothetical protein LBH44_06800 [Treponema sp.]|jgi:hypothetical protein|nr:hypothetical protein [Treponema sp.]
MKRLLLGVCLIIGMSAVGMAQEEKPVPGFSLGGGSFFSSGFMDGGSADFAFLIFQKNYLDIRNHFVFRGGSFSDGGIMMLTEKISFGGMAADKWRSYGYAEGGIGFTANEAKGLFEQPLTFSVGGGGGTDLFLARTMSIYFEAGGLFTVTDNVWAGGGIFQIGWKGWF